MRRSSCWSAAVICALASSGALAEIPPQKAEESAPTGEAAMHQPDGLYDAAAHERKNQASVTGIFAWGWGLGVGARYSLPLLKDGFLPEFNESIEVDFGLDFVFPLFGNVGSLLMIAAEPRWTFHILPKLDAYAKIGILGQIYIGATGTFSPIWVNAAIGGLYKLTPMLWARVELGNVGPRLGVGYDF